MAEQISTHGSEAEAAFRSMIRVYGLIGRIMHPYFGRMGISGSQWGVLRTLYRAEQEGRSGLRMLELGDKLLVRPPSVSGLINRLQRLGFVKRFLSKTDLRGKEVRLTSAGRELVRQVLQTHGGQIELLMGGLDKLELRQLSEFMNRLSEHLGRVAESEAPSPDPEMISKKESGELDLSTGPQQ